MTPPAALVEPAYCRLMARYNRWMNERLFALCAELSEVERKRDRRAFFGSIHGTLKPAMASRRRPDPRDTHRMKKAPGEERPGGFRFACQRGGGDGSTA